VNKQAPSAGRIATMLLFALSCFGLLLFLWLSFGGAIPLKPQGYRVTVAVPEATQLGLEADVRVAGVRVGKVRGKDIDPKDPNRTIATIELDNRFAPLRSDARAILRQKTLLGETYLELTPGTKSAKPIPEGGRLSNARVADTTQLDEIFDAFDPRTRQSFRVWQQELAGGFAGHGQDISDSFGNLPRFVVDADKLLNTLYVERNALGLLVNHTGGVFEALSRDEGALRSLITNSAGVFSATASQNERLAETFRVFPTFLDESTATFRRLKTFARDTDPLIQDLTPAVRDLGPTLRDVRAFAPDLRRLFVNLDPLIDAAQTGLPALAQTLRGATPLLGSLAPFLGELNPILEWLELYQGTIGDFLGNAANATANTVRSVGGTGHYLRQIGPMGAETLGIHASRLGSNRGNGYLAPDALANVDMSQKLIFPNWDCKPSNGPVAAHSSGLPNGIGNTPACFVAPPVQFQKSTSFPHVEAQTYGG
jgi:phospholipid/cholesterol/gamma-HCH transport system substrate-binding protein